MVECLGLSQRIRIAYLPRILRFTINHPAYMVVKRWLQHLKNRVVKAQPKGFVGDTSPRAVSSSKAAHIGVSL